MKNLLLVTRPLGNIPAHYATAALTLADEIILTGAGVYNRPEDFAGRGIAREKIAAVAEECQARRLASGFGAISWDQVTEAVERNDKVITL